MISFIPDDINSIKYNCCAEIIFFIVTAVRNIFYAIVYYITATSVINNKSEVNK